MCFCIRGRKLHASLVSLNHRNLFREEGISSGHWAKKSSYILLITGSVWNSPHLRNSEKGADNTDASGHISDHELRIGIVAGSTYRSCPGNYDLHPLSGGDLMSCQGVRLEEGRLPRCYTIYIGKAHKHNRNFVGEGEMNSSTRDWPRT